MHHAKKSLGQNFLKSEIALKKIIEAGEIKKGEIILEIGPGRGALTKRLLATGCQLMAVEKDRELFEFLKIKFEKEIAEKKLILTNDDILKFDYAPQDLTQYKIIANIPYNITGAILKKFLTAENQPERMILMVQHEVAKRIMARDEKESLLSISVKAYGEPKMIMKVDKRYFSPSPKVDSAIIAIRNISRKLFTSPQPSPTPPDLPLSGEANGFPLTRGSKGVKGEGGNGTVQNKFLNSQAFEEKFWEIVKAGFAHKRKKLSTNLKVLKYIGNSYVETLGNKRAEDLTLIDWISLAKKQNPS